MKKYYKLMLIGVALVLNGCTNSTPPESDGRKVFEKNQYTGSKILSFQKTNGKKSEGFYRMYYEAEIVYPNGNALHCKSSPCLSPHIVEIGGKELVTGTINFEKTENGWIGKIGTIYRERM